MLLNGNVVHVDVGVCSAQSGAAFFRRFLVLIMKVAVINLSIEMLRRILQARDPLTLLPIDHDRFLKLLVEKPLVYDRVLTKLSLLKAYARHEVISP